MPRLFVYGTLKRGGRNHRLMNGAAFVSVASTVPGFVVADLGPHPALLRGPGPGVTGEVWEVGDCHLDELDDFEEVPHHFTREEVELAGGGAAWAYLYARPVPPGVPRGSEWAAR